MWETAKITGYSKAKKKYRNLDEIGTLTLTMYPVSLVEISGIEPLTS
jgi:hypothetical protein